MGISIISTRNTFRSIDIFFLVNYSVSTSVPRMRNYGTIPTSSSEGGTNEFISTPQVKPGIRYGRPWKEMVRSLNLPSGFHNTIQRMKTNLVYFRTNYIIILMLIMCLSFLFHPVSFGVFLLLLADIFLILCFQPIMILLAMFNVISLLSTDAVWNIKSTLLIEAVIVAAHAFVRKTDDLCLDEEMPLATEMSSARPWKEMLWSLNLPSGFDIIVERIKTNLVYFETNYKIILMVVTCLSFLYHPVSLNVAFSLVMDVWLFLYYFRKEPSVLLRRGKVFVIIFVIISVIWLSFTEAAWINIISTMLIEAVVVVAHASFRNTDDLVVDEELAQPAPAGVLTTSTS